jgi:alanyl-tRNA synthetase
MTRKCFWEDPYLTTLDTVLTSVSGNDVTIAETILYAFSGGQESDAGTVGGRAVLAARKEGSDIVYTLDRADGLAPGAGVRLELDWPRRYALMRLHFAAELILELASRQFPGIEKIGAHIAADKARIDFLWEHSLAAALPNLANAAKTLIVADHPITSAFSDEAAQRRYWEIAGFARVPCGGTHLRRTGEVGPLALRRKNVGKNKERIEITLAAAG